MILKNTKKFFKQDRQVLDAKVSISVLLGHIFTNFTYALISGLLLAIIPAKNYLYIGAAYYVFKRFEGEVFKRGGYTSKLGNRYIWPLPSVFGFMTGVKLSELLIKLI